MCVLQMSDRGRGKSKTLRGRPRPLSHTHNDMSSHVAHHATPPLAQEDSTNVPPTQSPPNVVAATPSPRTSHSTPSPRSSETGDEPIIGSSESQTVSDDDKTTLILAGQGYALFIRSYFSAFNKSLIVYMYCL